MLCSVGEKSGKTHTASSAEPTNKSQKKNAMHDQFNSFIIINN